MSWQWRPCTAIPSMPSAAVVSPLQYRATLGRQRAPGMGDVVAVDLVQDAPAGAGRRVVYRDLVDGSEDGGIWHSPTVAGGWLRK